MHVKLLTVKYALRKHFNHTDVYETYMKDNGEKLFILNGKLSTKEEGNKHYLEVKNAHENGTWAVYSENSTERDVSDEEYLNELDSMVDKYTAYIDNYDQQRHAEENNNKIYAIMDAVRNN